MSPDVPSTPTSAFMPPDAYRDPVIEAYKKDVDRSMLSENLRLTVAERFERFDCVARSVAELQNSASHSSRKSGPNS